MAARSMLSRIGSYAVAKERPVSGIDCRQVVRGFQLLSLGRLQSDPL